ncbi:MAG TPA: hypothetical protein P5110_01145 [Candidatus Omnitrophota bacterium]|nr:hypothetical protein [Candidatus Omnitrophota bacterium]HRZ14091.1 hypothetical protein [Candidatus Omnitrophota bacterium]
MLDLKRLVAVVVAVCLLATPVLAQAFMLDSLFEGMDREKTTYGSLKGAASALAEASSLSRAAAGIRFRSAGAATVSAALKEVGKDLQGKFNASPLQGKITPYQSSFNIQAVATNFSELRAELRQRIAAFRTARQEMPDFIRPYTPGGDAAPVGDTIKCNPDGAKGAAKANCGK